MKTYKHIWEPKSEYVKDNGLYYDVMHDLNNYPDAWCYVVFGGRNTGKTYSGLRCFTENDEKFIYVKRTLADIKLLVAGSGDKAQKLGIHADFSPFVSINRDFGTNYQAFMLGDFIGVYCECDSANKPIAGKDPVGFVVSLSEVGKYKGFDLSYCETILLDEFVPKVFNRISKGEGDAIMELYQTVSRDREIRGLPPLKLVCFANADNAASPLTNTLEITDQVVKMATQKEGLLYLEERGILIRRLVDNKSFQEKMRESHIYRAMKGTRWANTAFENEFGYNDFSQITKIDLRRAQPIAKFKYKQETFFIYIRNETYLLTKKQSNKRDLLEYDLNTDAGCRSFYLDFVFILLEAAREHRCEFESYTLTRLIYEYKKIFNI